MDEIVSQSDFLPKLLQAPHNSLKGKTIKSFKSNGRWKGYTLICTDGTEFLIDAGFEKDVYVTKVIK